MTLCDSGQVIHCLSGPRSFIYEIQGAGKITTKVPSSSNVPWFSGTENMTRTSLNITIQEFGQWAVGTGVRDYLRTRSHCLSGSRPRGFIDGLKLSGSPPKEREDRAKCGRRHETNT